ncbi:TRAP transporter small permease subunit [Marinobacterium rhizophilum]|uniref:TRAP transporter small permease protein n=1 Tax=Marinobacterium rhizophilum TaxID=420402 RepID=A0ABY5HR85_9GAMM|nr:TRAP transporter small permease [Marinobacterium rhizophilum]UTW13416.1 TRAP transporter small permease subunit [Marinobacterium rhizophilum]
MIFTMFISRLSICIGYACAPLYLASLLIAVYEVVMRYFFNAPSDWAFEVTLTLCAVAWALSVGFVGQQSRHIAITFLRDFVPNRKKHWLDVLTLMLTVVAFAALAIATAEPAWEALTRVERTGSAFNPPMPAILKPILFVAACLGVLQTCANLCFAIMGRTIAQPDVPEVKV